MQAVAPAKKAFFFPGQGAQTVGMAKELCDECPEAKALFDKASDILGYDLLDVCVNGPAERLNSTEVSQPAIYVASLAALEKMKSTPEGAAEIEAVDVCAGLSLGEYTALTFAGAISFEDGVKLVKLRGESMQAAADATASSMASVIGLSSDKVDELCKAASEQCDGEPVQIANYLCNAQLRRLRIPWRPSIRWRRSPSPSSRRVHSGQACGRGRVPHRFHGARGRRPPPARGHAHRDPQDSRHLQRGRGAPRRRRLHPRHPRDGLAHALGVLGRRRHADHRAGGLETSTEVGPGKVIAGIMKRVDKKAVCENFTV